MAAMILAPVQMYFHHGALSATPAHRGSPTAGTGSLDLPQSLGVNAAAALPQPHCRVRISPGSVFHADNCRGDR